MKTLLVSSVLLFAMQTFAFDFDYPQEPDGFDVSEVQVILACDSVQANVKNWYVLGRVNYGEPQLFNYSLGRLIPATNQTNLSYPEDGRLYEIRVGILHYIFNLTLPGQYELLIITKDRVKVDLLPCRDSLQ